MGGITSGIGLFSGIDTASLIDQLISAQSRPIILAQNRVFQLQQQQAAYLDINSRLNAFKSAASSFRVADIFSSRGVASNNESVLTATASNSAVAGSYNFVVDRLVTTQQLLTRGFADLDSTAVGLDSLTFESEAARLDSDTPLADLNNGDGIKRGVITVNGTEVDLSRVSTTQEVLDLISEVPGVSARVENDHFVISGVTSLAQETNAGILESLGLDEYSGAAADQVGTSVYGIQTNTSLASLNDGRGVQVRQTSGQGVEDFTITIDGDEVNIRIGEIEGPLFDDEGDPIMNDEDPPVQEIGVVEGAVSTIGGVINRMNSALDEAGYTEFNASINATSGGIDIVDSLGGREFVIENFSNSAGEITTAEDLGLVGTYTGTANGTRILAGLNTKLVSSLNGRSGLDGTDGDLYFETQDGSDFTINVGGLNDVNDIINTINNDVGNGGRVFASINPEGTGIQIVDSSTGGDTFTIYGTNGSDSATALGIAGSFDDGTAAGSNLQLAYISNATLLDDLNNGEGIGTGTFEIVDSYNNRAEIRISNSDNTIADLVKAINGSGLDIIARINDNGDGIAIYEDENAVDDQGDPRPPGANPISVADITGSVASKLGLEGEASGTDADNFVNGSFEKTINFDSDATLSDIRNAINAANVGVSASILNTGIGASPFRLNLSSERTGGDGRFLLDSAGFDLGITTLDEGNDARVFFGSSDPATGVLLTSSVNQLDGIIQGVTIDLHSSSDDAVQLSVTTDTATIESKVSEFVASFNSVVEGIDFRTRYDDETEERGILLGDSTLLNLRNGLYSQLRSTNDGFSDTYDQLTQVGISVGSGGKLEFDTSAFREAYSADPEAVEALFTRQELESNDDGDPNTIDEPTFSTLSVLGQLEAFADSYVSGISGVLQSRGTALDSQITLQESRIASIQESLENKRVILSRQFLAMEQAIGAFQTQGSSLSQLAALG